MGLQPLVGCDLVGAEDRPHAVVEDLGRGAGQGGQAGDLEPPQVVDQRLAQPAGALGDLQGGEAVDMDAWRGLLHRLAHVDVVSPSKLGWMPPCRQTSVAPRSMASTTRRCISSISSR